ncbi:MAG TPA: dihydrofolate reductase family protein [Solirubrobacterales bacterium]
MARLIYSSICSLDGYVADADGNFDWATPDEEVHAFVNELERPIGTYLYGRRMYETMVYWETNGDQEGGSPAVRDFAGIWRGAEKVVFSRTLPGVESARTRLEREFDPVAVGKMKATAERDLTVGGAGLAGEALRAGVVDECHLIVAPAIVGGGTRALPSGLRAALELLDQRRFDSGMAYLRYRVAT